MTTSSLLPNQPDAPDSGNCRVCGSETYVIEARVWKKDFRFLPTLCNPCGILEDKRHHEELEGHYKTPVEMNIRPIYRDATFEMWKGKVTIANEQAYRYAKAFADKFDTIEKGTGLYLYGGTGTGKTTLAVAILKEVKRGYMINCAELLDEIGRHNSDIVKKILLTELLVLDDLGSEQMAEGKSSYVINRWYKIINERWERRLSTIITSNMHPNDLQIMLGERVSSRILGVCVPAKCEGEDLRKRSKVHSSYSSVS